MPPKPVVKASVARPPISTSSLVFVPEDVVDGYQDRIETGIAWSILEQAARQHKRKSLRCNVPVLSFKNALKNKLEKSFIRLFLSEDPGLTLQQLWEFSLPIILWDNDRFANDEGHACFRNNNCITDNLKQIIKKAVDRNDRHVIMKELKNITVLRVTGSEMTQLDPSLAKYRLLTTLNLCSNYISEVDPEFLPLGLKMLELQSNRIASITSFAARLPVCLTYLGLARNLLTSECHSGLSALVNITVLDLADNDIYELEPILEALTKLPKLYSLTLAGNPCSVCAAYALTTLAHLPQLTWLDEREILPKDRLDPTPEPFMPHPDDLRSAYFVFTIFRVMSAPQPPKPDKGVTVTFHVEIELPLLDSARRQFLMYRRHDSLTELLPPNEDEWIPSIQISIEKFKTEMETESSTHESDIYKDLDTVDPHKVINYTIFESNKIQWNKLMTFQEPTVRIFCPDLRALKDTFRTEITARLIYYVTYPPAKPAKNEKKGLPSTIKPVYDEYCVLATIKCKLDRANWTQNQQHFHWDDTLQSEYAIHWGDGDLSVLQYSQTPPKAAKGKTETADSTKRQPPDNLTCHFGIGIETLSAQTHKG